MRRAARTDGNHAEVMAAFRALGCSVLDLSRLGGGCPDLAIGVRGRTVLIEVKDGSKPPSARHLTLAEQEFFDGWKGAVYVVEFLSDVQRVVERL